MLSLEDTDSLSWIETCPFNLFGIGLSFLLYFEFLLILEVREPDLLVLEPILGGL